MDSCLHAGPLPISWRALAANAASSVAIRWKTAGQSPAAVWRNNRIVGYHGLSSQFKNQRHSGADASASQTGTANAPARWAIAVSELITRSRFFITAAVSMNAP